MGLNIALSPALSRAFHSKNANQSKNRIWVSRIEHRKVLLPRSYRRKLFAVKLKKTLGARGGQPNADGRMGTSHFVGGEVWKPEVGQKESRQQKGPAQRSSGLFVVRLILSEHD